MTDPIITAITAVLGISSFGNILGWAMGIATGLAVGIIIYGGLLYTASGGSKSLAEEGKRWIMAALEGIAILVFAYILLNTINPALLQVNKEIIAPVPLPPPTVNAQPTPVSNNQTQQSPIPGSTDIASLATQILNDPNIYLNGPGGGCDSVSTNPGEGKSNPLYTIKDTAAGLKPYVCAVPRLGLFGAVGSCDCTRGGPYGNTVMNPGLLQSLIELSAKYKFAVSALTTGMHNGTWSYSTYHGHYSGEAVDLVPVPQPTTAQQWIDVRDEISALNSKNCGSESIFFCESSGLNGKAYSDCNIQYTTHIHWTCAR